MEQETIDLLSKLSSKIAALNAENEKLKALAISTSDEGTSFYYKDEFEAAQERCAELRNLIKKAVDWRGLDGDGISQPLLDELIKEAENTELRERISNLENDILQGYVNVLASHKDQCEHCRGELERVTEKYLKEERT